MKKSLYTVLTFVKINTRRFFRDRLALFFSIGFPLIFLFVFGGLNSGNKDVSFNVAVINHSDSSFAKQFASQINKSKVFNVNKDVKNLSEAKDKMSRSELDATIVLPEDFGDVAQGSKTPSGQGKSSIRKTTPRRDRRLARCCRHSSRRSTPSS